MDSGSKSGKKREADSDPLKVNCFDSKEIYRAGQRVGLSVVLLTSLVLFLGVGFQTKWSFTLPEPEAFKLSELNSPAMFLLAIDIVAIHFMRRRFLKRSCIETSRSAKKDLSDRFMLLALVISICSCNSCLLEFARTDKNQSVWVVLLFTIASAQLFVLSQPRQAYVEKFIASQTELYNSGARGSIVG